MECVWLRIWLSRMNCYWMAIVVHIQGEICDWKMTGLSWNSGCHLDECSFQQLFELSQSRLTTIKATQIEQTSWNAIHNWRLPDVANLETAIFRNRSYCCGSYHFRLSNRCNIYSSLVKFMKNLLLPTDLLLKTENSKAFIYLRVRAIIFLKNELCRIDVLWQRVMFDSVVRFSFTWLFLLLLNDLGRAVSTVSSGCLSFCLF